MIDNHLCATCARRPADTDGTHTDVNACIYAEDFRSLAIPADGDNDNNSELTNPYTERVLFATRDNGMGYDITNCMCYEMRRHSPVECIEGGEQP